jgi:outer membrane protein assembly factor BamB
MGCSHISNPQGWSGGVIVDDALIMGSMDGQVLSINPENGRQNWPPVKIRVEEKEENKRAVYGTPAIYENIVFVASYDGKLQAFALHDGRLLESEPVANEFVGGPVFSQGRLFVGSSDGIMHAYDVDVNGQTVILEKAWEFSVEASIWSTAAVEDNLLVFGSLDHNVYALDAKSGKELWKFQTGAAVAANPVLHKGNVYVGSFDSVFYSIDAFSGDENWRFSGASNWYWATPVLTDEYIYAPSLDGKIYALEISTGSMRWETEEYGPIISSPAIVSDMIAFGSRDGELRVAELSSGMILGSCDIDEKIESPIVSLGDTIYFSARDHSVRALIIKQNGNPDEKWDSPYFSDKAEDGDDPNPKDWSPSC